MKLKFLSILAFTSLMFATSCEDWLDVQPEGSPNDANFWQTDKHYTSAMDYVYDCLNYEETWGRDLFWEQGASDDIFFSRARGASQSNLANLIMDGNTEGSIKNNYELFYKSMAAANNVIYHALKMSNRTETINIRLGEAYFMRAFMHYMIAYRYGRADNGVPFDRYEDYDPYVTKIPEQRATVMDNYALIIEDLENAQNLLPWFNTTSSDDYGRATKDAAIALEVKTYAYWAQHDKTQWSKIPSLVDKLENEGGRALMNNFEDVFKVENEWGSEYIFSINSTGANYAGSIFPGIVLDNKGWGYYNGWGNFKPTLELYAEYDENDLRLPATIMKYGDEFTYFGEKRRFYSSADLECGFHFKKYMDPFAKGSIDKVTGAGVNEALSPNGDRPTTDLNVPIFRFAEMLLFKAEAQIETGVNAAQTLNRIAKRAGLGDNYYSNPTIQDLMHERRCELACEYTDRLMDLKRWTAAGYQDAKARLESEVHGLKYENRSDPDSKLVANGTVYDETTNPASKVQQMTINGKTFDGVIVIQKAKNYTDKCSVLPYDINEVIKAQGALKQNKGYASSF
ncbi:MAG: RagB/SusD family nutrient uptake outer membrane protein [Bacteroidales bacterium]|nr:RagB/SusD family nutrient uptake outer membrane protein [Bacteroidales bacterium]